MIIMNKAVSEVDTEIVFCFQHEPKIIQSELYCLGGVILTLKV